ncbi:tyrosine-type recombinase/integrase (plasmid) [Sulfurimonas lithotrophica]|uniref:Tyrosine-type recombinase/integrase n=2 Tax=Sulfurimonas lithotrophica TaxID=2590022 RepID=A0A5P8P337_9BACT|nr:tyrosine-type recombinase/integrase [Sulfurimonas lithotrophica]QFR49960.1 tyrosine-type recombinase/integrase [Sulfurimonas lithotrophica]QFR50537.1 tyrosine-type recombinase/integrase [Sulfurimonas lithotrophica]
MKKLIDKKRKDFCEYLENIRGYSDLSIKTYNDAIREALSYIEILEENGEIIFDLMPFRLKISELNSKTISKKLSAIRSFSEYLNEKGMKIVLKSDSSVKVAKTLPKPISHKHIVEALSFADEQESLVVSLLYTLGLRISELEKLKLEDISEGWVRVLGKGSKQRDIPILKNIKDDIDSYIQNNNPKVFLFEKNDEALSQNSLRYIIAKVFKRINLKVSPHQLRHSYATELLNANAPIADVSELLGHSSMATTQIYTKLGSALKKQNYNNSHPLCGVNSAE